ncbi:hypothetical protein J7643_05340 [bacterium]|nr:hypothetical protein [bacterium]
MLTPALQSQALDSRNQQEMVTIYEACIHVRETARGLLDRSDEMGLIAVNAEIAAAKSQVNQEAFMVLANETGKIARQMSVLVGEIQGDAHALAKSSLSGVEKSRRLNRIAEGLERMTRADNVAFVQQVASDLDDHIRGIRGDIFTRFHHMEEARESVLRQIVKIARITTYFRIEASRDVQHGAYFRNIADSLAQLSESADAVAGDMKNVIKTAFHA